MGWQQPIQPPGKPFGTVEGIHNSNEPLNDWTKAVVNPVVVCDTGELYHMPCSPGPAAAAAAAEGRGKAARKQCDAIASGVVGYDIGNRSAPQDILPDVPLRLDLSGAAVHQQYKSIPAIDKGRLYLGLPT